MTDVNPAAEAWSTFDAWCREWDPEAEMSVEIQAANYQRTCDMEQEIKKLWADRQAVWNWMREPDYVENASLEWLTDWINRRPMVRVTLASALREGQP